MENLSYLEILSEKYPTAQSAYTEIINLQAILNLPKGTEHFFSDLHGEDKAFIYLLKGASGVVGVKVDEALGYRLSPEQRAKLLKLIHYPREEIAKAEREAESFDNWCRDNLYNLIELCKAISFKYTRSKVRKCMPEEFAYILDELLHTDGDTGKTNYNESIVNSIIDLDRARQFICALSDTIYDLAIDKLHILGDIYDRGPRPDLIMDYLMNRRGTDIQWGNHDIVWIGAAAGSEICVANALRINLAYYNFDLLEDGYGINLRELAIFAEKAYAADGCENFMPKVYDENIYGHISRNLAAKMHKAIAVIQFKLQGQLSNRHPEYGIQDRILLDKVNFEDSTITIDSQVYKLKDGNFPTVNRENPLELTSEEREVLDSLVISFMHSERLNKHIRFLLSNGSIYKISNGNLLFHGCIPMTEGGDFSKIDFLGGISGKEYLEYCDASVRKAYYSKDEAEKKENLDFIWYLWQGAKSPINGKKRLTTFENYFVVEGRRFFEEPDPYYTLIDNEKICDKILNEFSIFGKYSHIINGHVPVKADENPVKAGGKLIVIDGGLSKAYQSRTGVGGYTLIYNSRYLALAAHQPFSEYAKNDDRLSIGSNIKIIQQMNERVLVSDTDDGKRIREKIDILKQLIKAYDSGFTPHKNRYNSKGEI